MEENVRIYRRYIVDISCIGGRWHNISWRFIEWEKYRRISAKNRQIWWKIINFLLLPSTWSNGPNHVRLQRSCIWRPKLNLGLIQRLGCFSNGKIMIQRSDFAQILIQRLKLFFNGKIIFQWLFWPKIFL